MGLAEAKETVLDDIRVVKPTMLVAVPVVYNRIYDGVRAKLAAGGMLTQLAFKLSMGVAQERREWFDSGGKGSAPLDPWLWLRWHFVKRLILSKVTSQLGGRLHLAMTGGAALSPIVQQWFGDIGIPIIEGYGLTETSPVVVSERFGPTEFTQGGLRELPGVRVHICQFSQPAEGDAASTARVTVRGADEEGEICVVGPNVMMGYHKRPDATADVMCVIDGEPAFRTGDLGVMSAAGVVRITGRANEQYKLVNGKFVVPGPVEDTIRLWSPLIEQTFVYGHNRAHNVVLVVPDFAACAAALGLKGAAAKPEALASNPKVKAAIEAEIDRIAPKIAVAYAVPRAVGVLAEPFTVENGLLTPKLSTKRKVIAERYAELLASLY
jgi:long-chain acyl-CoA synthetase